jgi:hypothetical protein
MIISGQYRNTWVVKNDNLEQNSLQKLIIDADFA